MLIGHQTQLNFLRQSFEKGTMPHAYLFVGPEGVGKRKVANEVAGWLLGREIRLGEKDVLDFGLIYLKRERDLKTNKKHKDISLDQIQHVKDYLGHHSLMGSAQVVVIDEADFLSRGASNALLKTLEEPKAAAAKIILLAVDESNLLPTISSRCQVIRFPPVSTKEIYQALTVRGARRDLALEIARLACNRPGRALEMLAEAEKYNFYKSEAERFFFVQKGGLSERFKAVAGLFGDKAEHADHIENRDQLVKILQIWLGLWRDFMIVSQGSLEELIKNVSFLEKIKIQAKKYGQAKIIEVIKKIDEAIFLLKQNIHPKLIMENLILVFY